MPEQPMKVWEQAYKKEKIGKEYARTADEGVGAGIQKREKCKKERPSSL